MAYTKERGEVTIRPVLEVKRNARGLTGCLFEDEGPEEEEEAAALEAAAVEEAAVPAVGTGVQEAVCIVGASTRLEEETRLVAACGTGSACVELHGQR